MYILRTKLYNDIYTYPYTDKSLALSEFNKVLDKYYRSEEPNITYYKDIQYYSGNKIEVTLDWYEDVDLGVLK